PGRRPPRGVPRPELHDGQADVPADLLEEGDRSRRGRPRARVPGHGPRRRQAREAPRDLRGPALAAPEPDLVRRFRRLTAASATKANRAGRGEAPARHGELWWF